MTGEAVASTILQKLDEIGLNCDNLRGQEYDGSGSMAGIRKGASCIVLQKYPLATYVHCCSHILNLSIASSCSVVLVRNMMGTVSEVSKFFEHGKRQDKLEEVIESELPEGITLVQDVLDQLKELREELDDWNKIWFQMAVEIAEEEMEDRFTTNAKVATLGLCLVPSSICKKDDWQTHVNNLASLYQENAADPNSEHKKTPSRDRIEMIKCTEDAQEDPEDEGL
ncbi:hypothetical protein EMCRGX_G013234 [Ephydatia muelleri]